uniref:Protein P-30 n=1 Tax=Lithobates pipiens TaxID=8404 RepID=UPI000290CF21|nr:Chain A, Protein P-30 [Lithobates pipiens]
RPCKYKLKKSTNKFCVTCENQAPVHFVGVGSCGSGGSGIFLETSLSAGSDWLTFQKKHITNTRDVDCDNIMSTNLFHCKDKNTFIYSRPEPVKAICKGIIASKNVLTTSEFYLSDCNVTS